MITLAATLGWGRAQKSPAPKPLAEAALNAQVQQAIAYAEHGDASHALAVLEDVLRGHPNFVPAIKVEGMLLEDAGQEIEADAAFEKALRLSPNDADMLLKVGTLKLVHGQIDQSLLLLQHSVRLHPEDEEGNYYLAQAYHLEGKNELALASIRKAVQVAPKDVPVWQKYGELLCSSGENAEALEWLKKAQGADPSLTRINFDLAVASFNNMDLEAAAAYATTEAAIKPNDLDDLTLLASAEVKLAQWEQAKANLERVLVVRGNDAGSTMELGDCELESKDYPAAIAALQRALQMDPTQVLAHHLLSRAYAAQGDTANAQHEAALHREMMQHISVAMPKAEAKQQGALSEQAQELLKKGEEAAAVRLFETTLKGPYITRGSGWMSVGATYLSMGNPQAAERSLRHALELDPKTQGAHMYLGILAVQQGDLNQAQVHLEAELALDPNHPLALGELGEVRYRQGQWAEAVDLLDRSKTTVPSLLYMLCDSEFRLGKPQAADLTAETLVAYGKDEPALLQSLLDLLQRNGQTELVTRLARQP
ncbi:MAG: tetratricopeptide repeat protein [Janthinobacterium lividum]